MFPVAHNTLLAIDYFLATSFDLLYKSSSDQLYKNMHMNS